MKIKVVDVVRIEIPENLKFAHLWKTPPLYGPDSKQIKLAAERAEKDKEENMKEPEQKEIRGLNDFCAAVARDSMRAIRKSYIPETPPEHVLSYFRAHPTREKYTSGVHTWVKIDTDDTNWSTSKYLHFEKMRPKIDNALDNLFGHIEGYKGQAVTLEDLIPDLEPAPDHMNVLSLDKVPEEYQLLVDVNKVNNKISLQMAHHNENRPQRCTDGMSWERARKLLIEDITKYPEFTIICAVGNIIYKIQS